MKAAHYRSSRAVISTLMLLALSGCAREPQVYTQQAYVFGTLVDVAIVDQPEPRARELAKTILADFDRLQRVLHPRREGSLARMNSIFAQAPARASISPLLRDLVLHATEISARSDGLFNPAIGALIRLWGFDDASATPHLPEPSAIAALVARQPKMSDIKIDGIEFYTSNAAVQLDFGGYAKGAALDIAAQYLREQGAANALINIGGNIIALGKRGKRPWRIGIQDPRKPRALAVVELKDGEAIGTSGDYQRFFIRNGTRYSHIIDPRTGYPAQGTQAVTVLMPPGPRAGALSDALSKPIFIAGPQNWSQMAARVGVEHVLRVDASGQIEVSVAMAKRVEFDDPKPKTRVVPIVAEKVTEVARN